jgi:hypothetical protein
VKLKSLLCVPLGHEWKPFDDRDDPELRLRCLRCGRTQDYGPETRGGSSNACNRPIASGTSFRS